MGDPEEVIAAFARRQHAVVTGTQARSAGVSRRQLEVRVSSGRLLRVRRDVYAVAGAPPTWHQAVLAAVLAAGDGAWLSHASAAQLWGMAAVAVGAIEVLLPLERRVRLEGVVAHRSLALFTDDLTRRQRIPVTTAERTLVDLSGTHAARELGPVLDDALRRRVVRLDRLRRCVARLEGAPGRRPSVIHDLLAVRLPGYDPGDSDLETRVLRLLVARGLPPPVQQHRVEVGERTYRLDLSYPDDRFAIELDGWDVHRTRTAFDHDRARANALVLAGWRVVRFTSATSDEEILACVVGARRQRAG